MGIPSVFSILDVGIGPSSSHTTGPLHAAQDFRRDLASRDLPLGRIRVTLLGSLALTGKGHLTDLAITAGLAGYELSEHPAVSIHALHQAVRAAGEVEIAGRRFPFNPDLDILFDPSLDALPHPNTLRIALLAQNAQPLLEKEYRSIGGGAVEGGSLPAVPTRWAAEAALSMDRLLDACLDRGIGLPALIRENEDASHGLGPDEVRRRLDLLWGAMTDSIESGLRTQGLLPGRLKLERRAPELLENLEGSLRSGRILSHETTLAAIYAVAVAEENAAGGRIVMAPTCGSAGILPAVLKLLEERLLLPALRVHDALLVAGIVGSIVAAKASIAGAEVGCQGEVGTACAMAAAAACQVLDGSVPQVEAAAEMALEHHLGLTCDPVCGLVQIPCIERNAAAAVSALSAASLSLLGSGRHQISFDRAVATMRRIGTDMDRKYKETALGGLAVSAEPDAPPA